MKQLKLGERTAKRIAGYSELDGSQLCFWVEPNDGWYLYLPRCGAAALRNHKVVENADGTITVTPSILTTGHDQGEPAQVHGWLTNGVWKDA